MDFLEIIIVQMEKGESRMKIKILALLSVLTIALCGCSTDGLKEALEEEPTQESTQESEKVILNEYTKDNISAGVFNFTDSETDVCYLIFKDQCGYGGMGGITVRYNADGTIMVKEME
jgi:hypothetical protein